MSASKPDPLGELLAWVAATRYDDLPGEAVDASKAYLINTAAAILGGSGAPGALQAVEQVRAWEGKPESTVFVHGFKAPASFAAFANGVMAHAVDYDDTQVGTGFHPNASAVPALLAAAEIGEASGRELLAAHVLALEACCRMTLAATNRARHPWLTTTLFGVFGAAIAAGKLLRLDAQTLRHALGIAYSSAGGNRQGLLDGALIQRVQPGFTAQAALTSVLLARRGITGAHDVLEGRYGLYPSYYGTDYDRAALTEGLGARFRMLELALKPYPCCSYSQEPIEAALELAREHACGDDWKQAIVSVVSQHAAGLVDHPYEPRGCAQVDAQFSMQYVIAAALRDKALGLAHFQERALSDPGIKALARRVHVKVDAEQAGKVELVLKDGRVLSRRVEIARGDPRRPFTREELGAKLAECARHAKRPRSAEQAGAIEAAIRDAETLARGGELAALLA